MINSVGPKLIQLPSYSFFSVDLARTQVTKPVSTGIISRYVVVIAQCRLQCAKYFSSFSYYFAKNEKGEKYLHVLLDHCAISTLLFNAC